MQPYAYDPHSSPSPDARVAHDLAPLLARRAAGEDAPTLFRDAYVLGMVFERGYLDRGLLAGMPTPALQQRMAEGMDLADALRVVHAAGHQDMQLLLAEHSDLGFQSCQHALDDAPITTPATSVGTRRRIDREFVVLTIILVIAIASMSVQLLLLLK